MNMKFFYAILVSFLLHGLIIVLWPRIRHPKIKETEPVAGVTLIEDLSSIDLNEEAGLEKIDSDPPKSEKHSNEIHKLGKMITDRVIENLGQRRWEKIHEKDLFIPQIRLPKQGIIPDEDEYIKVWPEEFPKSIQMNKQRFWPPQEGIGHKDISKIFSNADIPGHLLLDEFPEEKVSQEMPDIIWKGTPRTWITKPEKSPTYHGDEEGLVKLRFWVNENGEVINAIPVQKLSAELEEKALAYIFSWRFEPSLETALQEGIIRINFKLSQNAR